MRHAIAIVVSLVGLIPTSAWAAAFDGSAAPALPDGQGGLASLSEKQIEAIRQARKTVRRFAVNARESHYTRGYAVQALQRLHEALNDWGRKGQLEWYLKRLDEEPEARVRALLAAGGMLAAKARQYHLGGAHAFWRKMDELADARGKPLSEEVMQVRDRFRVAASDLGEPVDLAPHKLEPYRLPCPVMDLGRSLKPYREPKKRR